MLARMAARGADRSGIWHGEGATLAVSRFAWELEPDFSNSVLLLIEPDLVVAADASTFYRDDLRRKLAARGIHPSGDSPSHLIAAAYRAWGRACPAQLEGEFAFVLWDRTARSALCSRDFLAKRPLYYAERPSALIVASTIGAVVQHPDVPADLNPVSIGATAAGLNAAGPDTCYAAVSTLPGGSDLTWEHGRTSPPRRHWEPVVSNEGASGFAEAAEELRDLLTTSVRERLASRGTTTVWMSGGWDSPSVFAAGQHHLAREKGNRQLLPVSISYPEGDPGREDDQIRAIADHWRSGVEWLDIADISLFDPPGDEIPRDEPFRHLYARWNGALAAGSHSAGSRVALDGNGGDQVFQVSRVYLADLLRQGHWIQLFREWRAIGGQGFRPFFRTAVQPVLPEPLMQTATLLRGGRRLSHYIERWLPTWISPDFAQRTTIVERDRDHLPQPHPAGYAAAECAWYWSSSFVQRGFAQIAGIALMAGVELRSPLADRRLVEFGLRRPRTERAAGTETKRLLRAAMKGLLPDHILAPRTHRTGTTNGFSHRHMSDHFAARLDALLQRPLLLEELGIVDGSALRRTASQYRHRGQAELRVALFYTYQTECWLRTRQPKRLLEKPLRVVHAAA